EAEAQEQLVIAEDNAQAEQRKWDSFVQDAEAPLAQTEAERVRVQQLERARFQSEERYKRLESEHGSLNLQPIQSSLFDADTDLTNLAKEIEQAQARLAELDAELQRLRDERGQAEGALNETRQSLAAARGRMSSLETLQQAALRQDDAELSTWLRQHQLAELPRLASALRVEAGWETAVEHVLADLLQAPLLPEFAQQAATVSVAPKSGAALLSAAAGSGGAGLAAKVQGPQAVLDLLSSIHLAGTADEARTRAASLAPGESVISADGVWRGRSWVRYPRSGDGESGVIARGQLLRELKVQVEQQTQTLATREQALRELSQRMQAAETERREVGGKFDQSRGRHAQRLAFRQAQAVRLEQAQARVQALVQELDALRQSREQQASELSESKQRLVTLEATANELRNQRAGMQQALATKRDLVSRARQALLLSQQARGQVQIDLASHKSSLSALEQSIKDRGAQRETLVARRSDEERAAGELDTPLAAQAHEVEIARAAVNQAREALRAAREKLEAVEASFAGILQAARAADVAKDAAQERVQAVKLEFENLRARREGYNAQIAETGFEREPLFAGLKDDATPEAWEEKLASILRRIERLGPINLAAIQELEEAQAREKYIGEQYADLTNALSTLEEAIRKIDAETKELFRQTFDKVDTIFREAFPRLFGGGEAYLELTGDDLLDTGVRVMARPPGKRNSSIQLLSGGEKAMTAVALLLALFQLTPAPFCLMDEVDAPLDDANVVRFTDVVREMSKNVQFIIITHNKITMELAQQLHGVTMQEPGVSRLVSVDVAQAVELAGKNEVKEVS
ncbi:MAG TPA: hypothetical protein VHE37_12775, partial [Nevskiaceae bacterium]|nr:hypothetical protein [Nevskiaceae bacterium]